MSDPVLPRPILPQPDQHTHAHLATQSVLTRILYIILLLTFRVIDFETCIYSLAVYKSLKRHCRLFPRKLSHKGKKCKCGFYIAQYPVRWTAQGALYFLSPPPPPGRHVHSGTNSAFLGSILAMPQLHPKTIHSHFHHCL